MHSLGWMPFPPEEPLNKRSYFCQHLTNWLIESDWHFTTLLAACIRSMAPLPDDINEVIDCLLVRFPDKPDRQAIELFLHDDSIVLNWFKPPNLSPEVVIFNLNVYETPQLSNTELPALNSLNDVAIWLDLSPDRLDWLVDLWRHDESTAWQFRHYRYGLVAKRDGSYRLIESPKKLLKQAQRKITGEIIQLMPIHNGAHGFVRGRNCQSHAALHCGKKYLMHFDLSHCFQRIRWSQIFEQFKSLGYRSSVCKYLTALCSHRCYFSQNDMFQQFDAALLEKLKQRHLPQGAPSSPALSNAVLIRLDKRLAGLATNLNLNYSRYADDFVFSGDQHLNWSSFAALVGSICLQEGFTLNYRKTRLAQSNQRQKITGIVVNQKLNIDRRYFDRLKAILTNCIRHGLESQNLDNHPNFADHLRGCVTHVASLNRVKGNKLDRLLKQIH